MATVQSTLRYCIFLFVYYESMQSLTARLHNVVSFATGSGATGDVLPHSGGTEGGRGVRGRL